MRIYGPVGLMFDECHERGESSAGFVLRGGASGRNARTGGGGGTEVRAEI